MTEPIELLASAARMRVQDKRHSALWHFIRANWRRVRRWHEREGLTFRAMAELLADHPDFAPDGRHAAPTERSVRVAYRSVEGFLGDRAEVPAPKRAVRRAFRAPTSAPPPDEPRTTFKTARLRGGKPSGEAE